MDKFKILFMQKKEEQHSTGTYHDIIASMEIEADSTETAEMIGDAMKKNMPDDVIVDVILDDVDVIL